MSKTERDMMAGIQLAENQCVVALDEGGEAWIIARSEEYRDKDLLPECSARDNGFNKSWDDGLTVGVYLVTLRPWAYPDYDGVIDCGFDVLMVEPLWTIEKLTPSQVMQKKEEETWVIRFYDSFDGWITLPGSYVKEAAEQEAAAKNAELVDGNKQAGEYYRAFHADTEMVFDAKYDPYRTGKNAVTEDSADG